MKIRFSKPIIVDAVSKLMACASSKNTLSSVEGILIRCEGQKVVLFSYDLEKGMRMEVEAEIIEEGSCIINAQSFNSIIKLMPAGMIELQVNEYYRAKLINGNSEFELNAMDAKEYPTLPDISNKRGFRIKQKDLKSIINGALFAVAQNDARATFNGAYFKMSDNNITVVGCDGFRLAVCKKECELSDISDFELDTDFIVPGRTLTEAVKMLSDSEESIMINLSLKQVIFRFEKENIVFFSRLIDGEYIDYERIIPKSSTIFVDIDRELFDDALSRVSLVSDEGAGKNKSLARCHFYDNKLEINSYSANGKSREEIPTSSSGGELIIGFNCRYLTDALKAAKCEKIRLSLSTPLIGMIIEPIDEEESFTYLVLPCKLK